MIEIPKTPKSYTTGRKLEVIELAEKIGNNAAGREFNINESVVRSWRRCKPVLKTLSTHRRALRTGTPVWPEMEINLKKWVVSERRQSRRVRTFDIILKAREMAKEAEMANFKGTLEWCQRFMRRHSLCVRAVTSVGQPLPVDWETKQQKFKCFVEENKIGINLQNIGNTDEVPLSFDLPSKFTVYCVGTESVKISTTGAEKCNFTVALCVTADAVKLKPFVIFKRKTIPKSVYPKGVIVRANENGWMTSDMMIEWMDQVWNRRKGSFFCEQSLLVCDSATAHLTNEVKEKLKKTKLAIIPGGLTKLLQPLDISVNKSFKSKVRKLWENWIVSGYHENTKTGRMKKAS